MNFAILWFVLLFFSSVLAQDDVNNIETEKKSEAQSCFPDMCDLLREFGAMTEKFGAMETRLKDSETRLKDSENQILELRNKERTKVIFSAATGGGDKPIGPFNGDTTLIYRRIITNVGNAYSQSTGIFVAPVEGVYYFSIFFHAGGKHQARLFLCKNSQRIVQTQEHKSKSDSADNGGNAVFLQLQRGDHVYVLMPAYNHVWGSDYHTTFSGFLVTQL